jgi:hypothetical protein
MPPEKNHSSPLDDPGRHARLKRARGAAAREFLLIVGLAGAAAVIMVVMGGPTKGADPMASVTHLRY